MAARGMGGLAASLAVLAVCAAGDSRALAEGPAYLVKDVTDGSEAGVSSDPSGFADLGGVVLFTAEDPEHGVGLWRTDGQPDGTALVADLGHMAGRRSDVRAAHRGVLYFVGPGGLWRSDGSAAGTSRLTDIAAIDLLAGPDALYAFGSDDALWRIAYDDGVSIRLAAFPDSQITPSMTLVGDRLFFAVSSAATEELWTSDGTAAGTRPLRAVQLTNREGGNNQAQLFAAGAQLFFVARDDAGWELWRSDGTEAGTRRVRDIAPGASSGLHFNDYSEMPQPFFAAVGDTLLFMANDGLSGLELWRSDGSEAGTQRVADLGAGALGADGTSGGDDDSDVAQRTIAMLPAGRRLFFTARPSGVALELWESDGTAAGTRRVARLTDDWGELQSAAAGDRLYLSVQSTQGGARLWTSDGTPSGTTMVAAPYDYASAMTPAGDGIVFAAADAVAGTEPWASDGTAAGTRRLVDIAVGRPGLDPNQLTDVAGTLLFVASDPAHGVELWRSDGTAAGTTLVADIAPGARSSSPQELAASGATLYFSADDGVHGRELWRSDGTAAGTHLVKDIAPQSGDPWLFVPDGRGGVFFFASQPETGYEPWHSDGTTAGTRLVRDIRPGPEGSLPYTPAPALLGPTLLFNADDGEHGAELWRSDGTAAGTTLVADLLPGEAGADPEWFTPLNDAMVFFAVNPSRDRSLWRSDGTSAGTVRLADVGTLVGRAAVAEGRMLFATETYVGRHNRVHLWESDGTATGTFPVPVPRLDRATTAAAGNGLFAILDTYFPKLYRLDCGVLMESPNPLFDLVGLGDRVLFTSAPDVGYGTRLWTSDGSAAGTVPLQDLLTVPEGLRYRRTPAPELTRAGDRVFFVGDFGTSGRELWALPLAALPVVDAPTCPALPTPTPRRTAAPFECPGGDEECTVLALDAVAAEAGGTTTITALLRATDAPIAGIQNDLAFPDGITVPARDDGAPDCAVDPGIDKEATSFAFQPPGCAPGATCTGLRAIVISFGNADPIPDGAALYTCALHVAAGAEPGTHRLALSNLGASDPDGLAVPLSGIDGTIVVREGSGSRPSTGDASGSGGCQAARGAAPASALSLLPLALLWLRRRHG
ncbi:hypothetical protein KF840_13820 [bacterium]|nr:hypothetical protein [bacterium]